MARDFDLDQAVARLRGEIQQAEATALTWFGARGDAATPPYNDLNRRIRHIWESLLAVAERLRSSALMTRVLEVVESKDYQGHPWTTTETTQGKRCVYLEEARGVVETLAMLSPEDAGTPRRATAGAPTRTGPPLGVARSAIADLRIGDCYFADRECRRYKGESDLCFIACVDDNRLKPRLEVIKETVTAGGLRPFVAVEHPRPAKDLPCENICGPIIESAFCIVLLDGKRSGDGETDIPNPNVYWEYGFMTALRKHIIPLREKGRSLPFNVSKLGTQPYTDDSLGPILEELIRAALSSPEVAEMRAVHEWFRTPEARLAGEWRHACVGSPSRPADEIVTFTADGQYRDDDGPVQLEPVHADREKGILLLRRSGEKQSFVQLWVVDDNTLEGYNPHRATEKHKYVRTGKPEGNSL